MQARTREERFAIFREAETRLMTQMPILPVYTYASKHLVHPSVRGLPSNLMDFINFIIAYRWFSVEGHEHSDLVMLFATLGFMAFNAFYLMWII